MIVDTSALIAVVKKENGVGELKRALLEDEGLLPAPAYVEFLRVATGDRVNAAAEAVELIDLLLNGPLRLLAFTPAHARVAAEANAVHGTGNGRGGTLNLLDLMVYACAKVERRPILCTGRDFAATDVPIHPTSRA